LTEQSQIYLLMQYRRVPYSFVLWQNSLRFTF